MSTQNFYGPVGQVAGHNIHNHGGNGGNGGDDSGSRRIMLIERQRQHLAERDEVARNSRWNVYVVALLLIVLGQVACAWYGLHLGLHGAERLWPVTLSLIVLMAIDALLLQRHRNECARIWHYHNDAIGAINDALAVL